jgi:calmodulin-regulated spectrin-associated protein
MKNKNEQNRNQFKDIQLFKQKQKQNIFIFFLKKAKFQASLKWLFGTAYQSDCNTLIPNHLNEPFFEEIDVGKVLRADLVSELTRGHIYCNVCHEISKDESFNSDKRMKKSKTFNNVSDVLEYLENNSIHVTDDNDDTITWQDIESENFQVNSHLALMDSLQLAYSLNIMRPDNVISSLKKYTNVEVDKNDSDHWNLEEICTFWINKISEIILNTIKSQCSSYVKQSGLADCQPHIHLQKITKNDDISLNLCNGSLIAAVIFFYVNEIDFDLSDISLQEQVGFEESVENLNLIKEFCEKFLPNKNKLFCFNFEDFLYSPMSLKINKLAFIAELFFYFEIKSVKSVVKSNHFDLFKDYIESKSCYFIKM